MDRVFDNPSMFSGLENLMALYGYSLQVYADFSGYTDIAIGIALILGFHLPKNFNSPYKADNCGNFWKRWHISLSTWLKDYLYIPLWGEIEEVRYLVLLLSIYCIICFSDKRFVATIIFYFVSNIFGSLIREIIPNLKGWYLTNVNIMITMLLGGLWHGASWNFVLMGWIKWIRHCSL